VPLWTMLVVYLGLPVFVTCADSSRYGLLKVDTALNDTHCNLQEWPWLLLCSLKG
jgi:hypothetical protein